ncbi:CHAT domain-containing protein [Pseudomonas alkylphenolica]|uniref:CHAT domain-containing protein n=1 Tax=Pseudomonas alkylphenolica TaxID=237609 RepID=UPI0018D833D8|nr:CHAT domain-containing protein [Pseudomonas alkylphenolica]MBH3428875.1 CHAT domain-containing protein [Pseudomonas alkylphenolica]
MKPKEKDTSASPLVRLPLQQPAVMELELPQAMQMPSSRGVGAASSPLLDNLKVKRTWRLAPVSRSGDAPHSEVLSDSRQLLALEAADGTTIFIRTDTLVDQLRRSRPELVDQDGVIDFAGFTDSKDTSRGALGWIWRQIIELELGEDDITQQAQKKIEALLGGEVEDWAAAWAAHQGANALMAAIEGQLAATPGLYFWDGGLLNSEGYCAASDARLAAAAQAGPLLVFIHGTGSHTLGSFGDLPGSGAWKTLRNTFGQRIFGFEHRTFSESPIDNALALVSVLPVGSRVNLVTHSRGGLVGDLLCMNPIDGGLDELIEHYRSMPRPDEVARERDNPALAQERKQVASGEQAKLRQLLVLLKNKNIQVGRYVRVAAPVQGTALLSENMDVFLSCLLTLVRKFGAWSIGAAVGAVATPLTGVKAKALADRGLKFLSRVVLEIADKRLQPQVIPGIEAMLPESPMGMLLARAGISPQVRLAVIAGDVEGGRDIIQRIGVMFVDWAFFDRARNDLVVDTDSMYGGMLPRGVDARAIFIQSPQVNHFRYFRDDVKYQSLPLPSVLSAWLLNSTAHTASPWKNDPLLPEAASVASSRGEGEAVDNTMPVLILLPGILGSHLAADRNRVWLDPLDLARGHLSKIDMESNHTVTKDGIVELAYGKLAKFLQASNKVIRFDYDWRQPIEVLGKALVDAVRGALVAHPDQPIRLLAHSMGGLVVRSAFAVDKNLWPDLIARPGGRLLMLGTPNQGAYSFVENLLGQSDTVRMLARVDLNNSLQEVLDIVAGFPGALHLLPAPGFEDAGGMSPVDFYQDKTWTALARVNNDRWFGRNLGGRPRQAALDEAREFWREMSNTRWVDLDHDRVAYVFGKADNTPCGLQVPEKGDPFANLMMLGTPNGDGSVTWRSGRLGNLPEERYWFMPVDHGGLTSTRRFFEEIQALLSTGVPNKLGRLPISRSEEKNARTIAYRAGPQGYPSDEELISRAMGSRIHLGRRHKRRVLQVAVKAMDLSFLQVPVMCGHYRGDPISGAEAIIDQTLVNGALSQRQWLGLHSGELGNGTVVLMPRTTEEHERQTGLGALVVGLGEMGTLTNDGVIQAVRSGVLRYLLHASDFYGSEGRSSGVVERVEALPLRIASLLIGTNSSAQLSVADSVKAIVQGVMLANRAFAEGAAERGATPAFISRLDLVEVFRDAAISAATAVCQLDENFISDPDTKLELAQELEYGPGVRQRLSVTSFNDYWPRLSVGSIGNSERQEPTQALDPQAAQGGKRARGFHFAYMGEKARVEAVVAQRQPGLVEKLIESALKGQGNMEYRKGSFFGNNLFQLLLPLEFKSSIRRSRNLILMVDESSADLPWEMLETDGEPLVNRTRLIRQFITAKFRREVIRTDSMNACVISNPATKGYYSQFGGPDWKEKTTPDGQPLSDSLPSLTGAAQEGGAVAQVLEGAGYQVTRALPGSMAGDVLSEIFARPYRVLVIAAHGIYNKLATDGVYRSGVVLSDGLLLTAAEIALMETVPDLVFLSCCHLGKVLSDGDPDNRLAASLARELIEMGVRCVVAAGWEVRDDAAKAFCETFFLRMAMQGESFGEAISDARKTVLENFPDCNTWGAYQAYGDPSFRLKLLPPPLKDDDPLRAPEELLDWLERVRLGTLGSSLNIRSDFAMVFKRVNQRLHSLPPHWMKMAEVQYAVGLLYSEFGLPGYDEARRALLQSISIDSARAVVPLSAIEQLVNIETRQAQSHSEKAHGLRATGSANDAAEADLLADAALVLINDAIARVEALIRLTQLHPDNPDSGEAVAHCERQAILGSAYKRKAVILLMASAPWKQVNVALRQARDAYALGDGDPSQADWNPYIRINCLQLDALLGKTNTDENEITLCQTTARARFQKTFDFFDAVMSADAAVAGWLLSGSLPDATIVGTDTAAALSRVYWDALMGQRASVRQFESVIKQLILLANFLLLRRLKGDSVKSETLRALAKLLEEGGE